MESWIFEMQWKKAEILMKIIKHSTNECNNVDSMKKNLSAVPVYFIFSEKDVLQSD